MTGLVWEVWAILWGKATWTLSYHVALIRADNPGLFWFIVTLMAWAIYHFLRDNIGGLEGLF